MLKYAIVESYGHGGDCAARAISTYFEVPYDEAVELLEAHTRFDKNRGCYVSEFHALIESMGLQYVKQTIRLTAKDAYERLPQDAILRFGKHVCSVKGGVIYDAFETTKRAGCKQIQGYWIAA